MVLDSSFGDVEAKGYLPVGSARAHELRDLHLRPERTSSSGRGVRSRESVIRRSSEITRAAICPPRTVSSLLAFSMAETNSSGGVSFRR